MEKDPYNYTYEYQRRKKFRKKKSGKDLGLNHNTSIIHNNHNLMMSLGYTWIFLIFASIAILSGLKISLILLSWPYIFIFNLGGILYLESKGHKVSNLGNFTELLVMVTYVIFTFLIQLIVVLNIWYIAGN